MKYIVYLTICTANTKIYIGVHQTIDPDVFDGYIGNGVNINTPSSYKKSKTPFQYAVNKYGVDKFRRVTLRVFDTKEEAFALEAAIVTEEFIRRPETYNIQLGGAGGCAQSRYVKVYMYDLEGNFVKEFESAFECNRYFDINAKNGSAVLKAIRLGQSLHGFQFSREKLPYMKKFKVRPGSHDFNIKVGRYDDEGNLLEVYESKRECQRAGFKNVTKAIRQNKKSKGFWFREIKD